MSSYKKWNPNSPSKNSTPTDPHPTSTPPLAKSPIVPKRTSPGIRVSTPVSVLKRSMRNNDDNTPFRRSLWIAKLNFPITPKAIRKSFFFSTFVKFYICFVVCVFFSPSFFIPVSPYAFFFIILRMNFYFLSYKIFHFFQYIHLLLLLHSLFISSMVLLRNQLFLQLQLY